MEQCSVKGGASRRVCERTLTFGTRAAVSGWREHPRHRPRCSASLRDSADALSRREDGGSYRGEDLNLLPLSYEEQFAFARLASYNLKPLVTIEQDAEPGASSASRVIS